MIKPRLPLLAPVRIGGRAYGNSTSTALVTTLLTRK